MQLNALKLEVEAREWGISLVDRIVLESLCGSSNNALAEFAEDDWGEFEFRERVADLLIANGLIDKAFRYFDCARKGFLLQCEGSGHQFYSPFHCDLRFCPHCAPRQFARLMEKYGPILEFISKQERHGYRLREITLTSVNNGELTREKIVLFNNCVKKLLRQLLRGKKGWGAIYVDEVGFNNTNLHAHILFYGPYLDQKIIASAWKEISGNQVVWIKESGTPGPQALLYILKYVSKAPTDNPETVAKLEVAFHRARRVHALGIFYNFEKPESDEAEEAENSHRLCPKCQTRLVLVRDYRPIREFKSSGIPSLKASRSGPRPREFIDRRRSDAPFSSRIVPEIRC